MLFGKYNFQKSKYFIEIKFLQTSNKKLKVLKRSIETYRTGYSKCFFFTKSFK